MLEKITIKANLKDRRILLNLGMMHLARRVTEKLKEVDTYLQTMDCLSGKAIHFWQQISKEQNQSTTTS